MRQLFARTIIPQLRPTRLGVQSVLRFNMSTTSALPGDIAQQQEQSDQKSYTAAEVDTYLESKLIHPDFGGDKSLARSRQRADEAGISQIAVTALQGQFLSILAKSMGASKILEIGTLWGFSTVFLGRALPSHGQLDTLEISELHVKVAAETFLDADLYPFPKVHLGPALDTLKTLPIPGELEGLSETERGYDLVFIDADKKNIPGYFQESLRLTRKGGLIIVDNAVRRGRIVEEKPTEDAVNVRGLRRLYDWVEKDAGKTVLMTGIQTVGGKAWDGFAIATKL